MMETCFAPAERTDRRQFENQLASIGDNPLMSTLLQSVGGVLVVLNEDRQIVALNHAFLDTLGITDPAAVLGLRLGESLRCVHAHEGPHGCGTTPHCSTCGAAIAMMSAIRDGRTEERMCALTTEEDGVQRNTSLLVKAQPMVLENRRWILIFAQDMTQQQFWAALERVFFHDVSNILTAVHGNSELLALKLPENPTARNLLLAIERLSAEIAVQRTLSHRKDSDYPITNKTVALSEIRREVDLVLFGHPATGDRAIQTVAPGEDVTITTDPLLVSRVLGNMLINALEATAAGESVRLTTSVEPDHVVWEVWNKGQIPCQTQKRIFQRHFSTKAQVGRGLGTYSMKLFGERYLKGDVAFTSGPDEGTVFSLRLPRAAGTSATGTVPG